MKFFDGHIHLYPDAIAERAVSALGAFYEFVPEGLGTCADYFESCTAEGGTGFLVLGVATNAHQTARVNDFIAEAVGRGRALGLDAYGFMGIHQDQPDMEAEIERSVSLGLCGAKIHPDIQGVDILDRRLYPLYEMLEKRELPLVFHVGDPRPQYRFSEPHKVAQIAREFPALRIGGAHLGGYTTFDEGAELFSRLDNVWVDCSSALWVIDPEQALKQIRRFGTDRVMFGTDYPVKKCRGELELFGQIPLTDTEREKILTENAKTFIGV